MYHVLEERYGLRPERSRKTLELFLAGPTEARLLEVTPGAPLFLLQATVFGNAVPMEHARLLLRGDRFRFQV